MKIRIIIEGMKFLAELNKSETARRIYRSLPIEGFFSTWGSEVYFEIPVKCEAENQKQEVEIGDLGYWLEGGCFCIFYGKTPASTSQKPKAASPVNVFGKIIGDATKLKTVSGNKVRVEKA